MPFAIAVKRNRIGVDEILELQTYRRRSKKAGRKIKRVGGKTKRAVLFTVYSGHGGAKVSTFFVASDLFILSAFRATIAIRVCKIIFMIRRIDWRALEVRARGFARETAPPPS